MIVLVAVLFGGGAGVAGARGETRYRSHASLALAPSSSLHADHHVVDSLCKSGLTATLAKLVPSSLVLDAAASAIDKSDRATLDVTARVVPDSLVVIVTVEGNRPEQAAAFSAAVVDVSKKRFEQLYGTSSVVPLDAAAAARPVEKAPMRAAAIGGTVGLGAGFLVGLLRDAITRVRESRRRRG